MINYQLKFEWSKAAVPLDGELIYRQGEYSFDFIAAPIGALVERVGFAGNTSLAFTTLQIEVGVERGELLYPWGLFPNTRWQLGKLELPVLQSGRIRVVSQEIKLQPGVTIQMPDCAGWPIVLDRHSGWICFGAVSYPDSVAVEYAKNAVALMADNRLVSLWLRPKMAS